MPNPPAPSFMNAQYSRSRSSPLKCQYNDPFHNSARACRWRELVSSSPNCESRHLAVNWSGAPSARRHEIRKGGIVGVAAFCTSMIFRISGSRGRKDRTSDRRNSAPKPATHRATTASGICQSSRMMRRMMKDGCIGGGCVLRMIRRHKEGFEACMENGAASHFSNSECVK